MANDHFYMKVSIKYGYESYIKVYSKRLEVRTAADVAIVIPKVHLRIFSVILSKKEKKGHKFVQCQLYFIYSYIHFVFLLFLK